MDKGKGRNEDEKSIHDGKLGTTLIIESFNVNFKPNVELNY